MATVTDQGVLDREPALTPSSDYIVYLDESGDHNLDLIDRHYPIFVLSACVFRKADYSAVVVPSFLNLKFRFFGHDMVVLHSRDIRKAQGPFSILQNAQVRQDFLAAINTAVADAPFTLVTAIIDKRRLTRQSDRSDNPYKIALTFCMEQVFVYLQVLQQHQVKTTMIVECRGKKEDADLELSFLRTVQGNNIHGLYLPFEIVFADKKTNSTGFSSPIWCHIQSDGSTSIRLSPIRRTSSWSQNSNAARPGCSMAGDESYYPKKRKAPVFTEAQRRPGIPNPLD